MRAAAAKLARSGWAEKIHALRNRFNLSQAELARKLNVSAMAVSRWERAVNEPPADAYIKLGKLAGNPDCWFFWQCAGLGKDDLRRALQPLHTQGP